MTSITTPIILIVEDDDDSAKLVSQIVEQINYEYRIAGTVTEAMRIFETEPIDILIIDLNLPETSGWEVLKQLKGHPDPHKRKVPTIAVTGYHSGNTQQLALEAGFKHYLQKPVDPLTLMRLLSSIT